jgi:two-component system response regulator FixJ
MGLVYIIEPDAAIRDALEILLESVNVPVKGFADAEAFLGAVGPVPRGCILADAEMPGLNGLALLNELRKQGSKASVLLLADSTDSKYVQRAMYSGAAAVLRKPFMDDDVIALICPLLDIEGISCRKSGIRSLRPM